MGNHRLLSVKRYRGNCQTLYFSSAGKGLKPKKAKELVKGYTTA
jgi:hypothetical protein